MATKKGKKSVGKKQAKKGGFGFGASPKLPKEPVKLDPGITEALEKLAEGGQSIENYLAPQHFQDPEVMSDIAKRLQAGEVVVLRNAFREEFAEMVYQELYALDDEWEFNEGYFPDGYAFAHHNVFNRGKWSERLNSTLDVFANEASRSFIQKLTGRDCSGETTGAPSWYKEGEHSLPHTDWVGQRTVAYVWHLSKNWKPEWGGALYWAPYDHAVATFPASFNTLVLFSVSPFSPHFVTTVSPYHRGKRLTFNGWWHSPWVPTLSDDLEKVLASKDERRKLTHTQIQEITDLLADDYQNIADERRELLEGLRKEALKELFPKGARTGSEA